MKINPFAFKFITFTKATIPIEFPRNETVFLKNSYIKRKGGVFKATEQPFIPIFAIFSLKTRTKMKANRNIRK